ncbi:DUF300-domain-containing protein [Trichodelitschia bisporula]|uniref:DUF300-domain-containing protein n=1 Tax=Trichodelitschia bisporula TaxID=703511 RepID=A0A6G1HXU6_9PEZI|nr:DUF300-domain-containing protein [Trichodelitschia bisporula]
MSVCNNSLITAGDELVKHETPLWKGFTFHHFGLIITATFGLIAVLLALFLMMQHARHYSVPGQQKHIIRIVFMIPVYATISFVSYVFYRHAIYWEVLRDCYEAFAIAAFFALMSSYIEPTLHDQKEYFRKIQVDNWVWPVPWMQKCTGGKERGLLRRPRSGLTWFNIIWVAIFQYCAIRVLCTFVSMISQLLDRYCESSLSPAFAHVWVMVIEGTSVSVAMYCVIQFYFQLKTDLAEYRPFLKVLCIKLVIFFSFWQAIVISFLSSSSSSRDAILKPSDKIAYPDIKIGIPSMLIAVEMSIFAGMHMFAFSWKPYDIRNNPDPAARYQGGPLGLYAFVDAFNLWDVVKASARGFRWLFHGRRRRMTDPSYRDHLGAGAGAGAAAGAGVGAAPRKGAEDVELHSPPRGRTDDPRPPIVRRPTDDDHQALLADPQGVPRIAVRAPSPYSQQSGPRRI